MIFANDLKKLFLTSLFNGILIKNSEKRQNMANFYWIVFTEITR